jgi:hypothetical protein
VQIAKCKLEEKAKTPRGTGKSACATKGKLENGRQEETVKDAIGAQVAKAPSRRP